MVLPTRRDEFFSFSLDMLCVANHDGYFLDLNPMWQLTLGWTVEELKAEPFVAFVHPEDRAATQAGMAPAEEGASAPFENRFLSKDGSYHWLMWSTNADIENGRVYAVARDVTDQRAALAALRKSESQRELVFNASLSAVVTIDQAGLITGWNTQAEATFGWTAAEVLGVELAATIVPPQHRDAHRSGLQRFLLTGDGPILGTVMDLTALRRDGTEFPVEVAISRGAGEGEEASFVGFMRDITLRKTVEAFHDARLAVNRTLASFSTWREAAPLVLEAIVTALGWDIGEYWNVEDDELRWRYGWQNQSELYAEFLSISAAMACAPANGLPSRIRQSGQAMAIGNFGEAGLARSAAVARFGLHSAVGVPVFDEQGEVLAVAIFISRSPLAASDAVLDLIGELGTQIGLFLQREAAAASMEYHAMHDTLTGLPNRALFADRLSHALAGADRAHHSASVIMIDLDGFKQVNDTLGHEAGDQLLVEAGRRLQGQLRHSDTVARLGGDEFGIVAAGATGDNGAAGAQIMAKKLRDALAEPFCLGENSVRCGGSIGIALYPEHGSDPTTLLSHADAAMYSAKISKTGYAIYDPAAATLLTSTDQFSAAPRGGR